MPNALVEIPWIHTTVGPLTVKEALIRAHEIDGLDINRPAFEVGATLRFLSSFLAVVGQEHYFETKSWNPTDFDAGIPPELVSRAIDRIGKAALLEDSEQPFLQQPILESHIPGDPVKKLFPTISSDQADSFWDFATDSRQALPIEDAVLALCVFYNYSPAGNNKYGGRKCQMGSPGLHFPGKDFTATEIIWSGKTLLDTLLLATPLNHITTRSLPAWADRDLSRSGNPSHNGEPPLWRSTWTSNAPACLWDKNFNLTAVRPGGIPTTWAPPSQGTSSTEQKAWWDDRNVSDPFYLYITQKNGESKAVRVDLGRDLVSIAVDWLAESKFIQLRNRCHSLKSPSAESMLFLRHLIGGTASSPSIRSSTCLRGDAQIWSPQGSESIVRKVSDFAKLIETLHSTIKYSFVADKKTSFVGSEIDASSEFWSRIEYTFYSCMRMYDPNDQTFSPSHEAIEVIRFGALETLNAMLDRYAGRNQMQIEAIRAQTTARINTCVNKYKKSLVNVPSIEDLL